jgi:hypothetical protein
MDQFWRASLWCALFVLASLVVRADSRIKTPFQVVPLWSDEMMSFLTGERQAACSGPNASTCERLNTGLCDGSAYLTAGTLPTEALKIALPHTPSKQTDSANPQYFKLAIWHAASAMNLAIFNSPSELDRLELVFDCSISGNDACPANRLQTGTVRRVELGPVNGKNPVDLTHAASVRSDGPIVVSLDQPVKNSLFSNPGTVYQVRVLAECFSVVPTPVEWKLPLYESPSGSAKSAGALIARVTAGTGMEFIYRPAAGEDVRFEPDRVQSDWGYTFMMDQTVLDRKGDWFQLPPQPFPNAVWIRLPGRESTGLNEEEVYTLSKTIKARSKGTAGTAEFSAGTNLVVVSIQKHALEIRKEAPFDMPCADNDRAATRRKLPTYVVDAAAFYDRLHLQLKPAYPKGC